MSSPQGLSKPYHLLALVPVALLELGLIYFAVMFVQGLAVR